ncbi:T9SS type A sorting domain-containing protein [Flavobacterium nackdongense]|uniref:T9SS type A sorting domain-containing protein n=1 Tax=Flavobacterium nackdongense TaxID=2547394 RepID=A0A4P6YG53_9FLAO|nr:T9SS type A sorting domain-containing protein [Flavobacterium nackdongense]QBN19530.1 T9SS type A sorting domain-containing protein [Flavobacterium nackdongense]
MKKSVFLFISLFIISHAFGQNYYMPTPEGFGEAATGGGTPTVSNTVTVTTYTQFKNALTSTAASTAVILVSGTIDCVYTSVLLTNKTIVGLPGARLRNNQITIGNSTTSAQNSGILYIKAGSNNVIVRNLIFEGPGAYDVDGRDNLTNEGRNIWVDHCEFQDGMDGNFDNKGECDNTTISWCKFTYLKPAIAGGSGGSADHRFSNLVGSAIDDLPSSDGRYSVTFKNCYWAEGCKARMPRARNAELHVLNCYFKTNVSGASAVGLGAGNSGTNCYVENCNFEQIATISSPVTEGTGTTSVKFDGCTKGTTPTPVTGLDKLTATKPTYTYTVFPVDNVASYVSNATCGAGATLNVNATGEISSACPNLGLGYQEVQLGKLYPTVVDSTLHINLSDNVAGHAMITIFSSLGAKLMSYSKASTPAEKLSLNVSNLASGLYLCHLSIGANSTSWKFIKK